MLIPQTGFQYCSGQCGTGFNQNLQHTGSPQTFKRRLNTVSPKNIEAARCWQPQNNSPTRGDGGPEWPGSAFFPQNQTRGLTVNSGLSARIVPEPVRIASAPFAQAVSDFQRCRGGKRLLPAGRDHGAIGIDGLFYRNPGFPGGCRG